MQQDIILTHRSISQTEQDGDRGSVVNCRTCLYQALLGAMLPQAQSSARLCPYQLLVLPRCCLCRSLMHYYPEFLYSEKGAYHAGLSCDTSQIAPKNHRMSLQRFVTL